MIRRKGISRPGLRLAAALAAVLLGGILQPPLHVAAAATLYAGHVRDQATVRASAVGSDGVNHVLMTGDPSNTPAYYANDRSGAWTITTLNGNAFLGDVATDSAGHVYIAVWTGVYGSQFPYIGLTTDVSGSMVTHLLEVQSGFGGKLKMAFRDDGVLEIAMLGPQAMVGQYVTWDHGTWGAIVPIAPALLGGTVGGDAFYDIAVDAAGRTHVIVSGAFTTMTRLAPCDGSTCTAVFSEDGAGGWTVERLENTPGAVHMVRFGTDGLKAAMSADSTLVHVWSRASGTWSMEAIPSSSTSRDAWPTIGPAGALSVFWHDLDGSDRRVRRSVRGASTWTTTILPFDGSWMDVALDAAGDPHVAYSQVKWYDQGGNGGNTFVGGPDTRAPKLSTPTQSFRKSTVGSTVPMTISWSGSDALAGISRYEVARKIGTGSWTSLGSSFTAASLSVSPTPGSTQYQYRVRGWDKAGNVSGWSYGPTFTVPTYQDTSTSIKYSGTWSKSTSTVYWSSSDHYSSSTAAYATITTTGRAFAWVAAKGPTRGRAAVYVDGSLITIVDLYASTTSYKRIVWAWSAGASGSHTVKIVVYATSSRHRVDVDALVVAR